MSATFAACIMEEDMAKAPSDEGAAKPTAEFAKFRGQFRAPDGLEEGLEARRCDHPQHHQLAVALVDELVGDILPEQARRPRHERDARRATAGCSRCLC